MEHIYHSVTELIGGTPLVELHSFEKELAPGTRLLAKVEGLNPSGSVKDRAALSMIQEAERSGRLKPGGVIIEPTSGNTGIGLAALGAAKGYPVIIVMPDTMSKERRVMIQAYGAQIVLTEGAKGMKGAIAKAQELSESMPGSFIPSQFENMANPQIHRDTTGPELWKDTEGRIDIFVAGVGTGGTLSGAGAYLKSRNPQIRIVAVEPSDSPVLSGGQPGPHKLQGIGAGFVPSVMELRLADEIVQVSAEEAFSVGRRLAEKEGVLAGISSGAALWAAMAVAKRPENGGRTVVVVLPDSGDRYLSTPYLQREE